MNIKQFTKQGAELDDKRIYRYALWRIWDETKPWVLFIGLNPSTADESHSDRTLEKCIHYASAWGYGGVYMANLFAFRATDPERMKLEYDPVGDDNDRWLTHLAKRAGLVIAAWGNDGMHMGRAKEIRTRIYNLKCLKVNKSGEPAHPLYQPNTAKPFDYLSNSTETCMSKSAPPITINLFNTSVFTPSHPAIRAIAREQGEPSIHGDKIWEASYVMMDFLEQFPLSRRSKVLEVGCGWGILTSYLARYCDSVTGLDADDAVKPYFDLHARQNKVNPAFHQGTMKSMSKVLLSDFDVIIGGDICFWDSLKKDWQNLIRRAKAAGVREIYIIDPGRPPFWELVEFVEKKFGGEIWSHEVTKPHPIEHYVLEIQF